jgi:sugar/nucleoside kinase (ribokinase family)
MNAEEADAYYRALNRDNWDEGERGNGYVRRVAEFLRRSTEGELYPIIVVKRGKKGAAAFAGGNLYRARTLAVTSPAETTGAGDAFCAAFLAAWIRNKPIKDCAALGNRAAREVLDAPGTQVDRKKLAHLAKLLRP